MYLSLPLFSLSLLTLLTPAPDLTDSQILGTWTSMGESYYQIEISRQEGELVLVAADWAEAAIPLVRYQNFWMAEVSGIRMQLRTRNEHLLLSIHRDHSVEHLVMQRAQAAPTFSASSEGGVIPASAMRLGVIKGLPTGNAASTASLFRANLYRVGESRELVASQPIDRHHGFEFSQLPEGEYQIIVTTQAMTAVEASPAFFRVSLSNGDVIQAEIQLN